MKHPSISHHARVGIGIVAAGLLLMLWPGTGRIAQRAETKRPPIYRLSVKDGDRKTSLKITAPRGRIAAVSGTNEMGTFSFKRVRKGGRPRLVAGPGPSCLKVTPATPPFEVVRGFYNLDVTVVSDGLEVPRLMVMTVALRRRALTAMRASSAMR